MLLWPAKAHNPDYIVDLYQRLPAIPKRLIQVDGSAPGCSPTSGRQQPS